MSHKITAGAKAPDFTFDSPWKKSLKFHDSLKSGKTILIFLRYMGCPICQMKISEIRRDWDEFRKRNLNVLVVLQSEAENVISVKGSDEKLKEAVIPFTIVLDPKEEIFKLYGVLPGSILRYITPGTIKKAMQSKKLGFKHGVSEGKELQLPAVFIVDDKKMVRYAYYGKNVSDVPENAVLFNIAEKP
ncbi:MAG: redoxin domain-containing protein [Deltaproteobacteria bacterium]|uniref:Redoxin domain-containing protein n=1 Tax=Candidatus Zymogenus saltonus TaxID=2844893 RepID=A0A9D8KGY5_9DELT|nr:redoxin domain-containing protein [Candidatus Zymogenus saltonus]